MTSKPPAPTAATITPREAASLLGIGMPLVYAWIDQGRLVATKRGGRIEVDLESAQKIADEFEGVKIGRPPAHPAEMSERSVVRSTAEDKAAWQARADELELELGTWLRRVANESVGRPVPDVGPGARRKLPRPRSRG
jgi:excisionase family DNA binding protein